MKRLVLPLLALSLAGCVSNPSSEKKTTNDPRECARNFTYDGSFLAGRTFKSTAFVNKVNKADAMKRATRYIAQNGFQISSTDEKLGIVSASQGVSYGQGKTAPLNVSFEQEKGGVQMDFSYSISGGVTSPVSAVQNFFCEVAEAVEGKK
ncbi:MAG: hypothetical protein LBQ75_10120 [Zoogloeaceae bacterium]|nr:hypothetical protein [Zoogloeaceae bacterium]